jgi:hypothetical protein
MIKKKAGGDWVWQEATKEFVWVSQKITLEKCFEKLICIEANQQKFQNEVLLRFEGLDIGQKKLEKQNDEILFRVEKLETRMTRVEKKVDQAIEIGLDNSAKIDRLDRKVADHESQIRELARQKNCNNYYCGNTCPQSCCSCTPCYSKRIVYVPCTCNCSCGYYYYANCYWYVNYSPCGRHYQWRCCG